MGRRRSKGLAINGWINLYKDLDMTSAHAVAVVKKLTNAAKVGHGGTLDPMATGVLPIALGEATKLVPYVMDQAKTYEFTVKWGEERDTDDQEGEVTQTSDARPTLDEIDALLPNFTGVIDQVPPTFSAIKIDGERAYDLARAGKKVEIPARPVEIFEFTRVNDDVNETRFAVKCGKGTYVRALARDLGRELGCYGHISTLSRTRVGGLKAEDAISLDVLGELRNKAASLDEVLQPMATALDDIPALTLVMEEARRVKSGQTIKHRGVPDGLICLKHGGDVIALAEAKSGIIKPVRVFNIQMKENVDVGNC
ncbi:MAG: tRNA pseudouridine(55) synthase TruB [Sphingomonadales bacterium]|jgi:tRNA pseudouridine55 synthase